MEYRVDLMVICRPGAARRQAKFVQCRRYQRNQIYARAWYAAAQHAAIAKIRPGARLSEIDSAARNALAARDLPDYGHGTGHGLGLQVHENPFMSKIAKGALEAGDVITVEPGVYIPGKLGVRIEDDILVTQTGHKVLTKDRRFNFSNKKMSILI